MLQSMTRYHELTTATNDAAFNVFSACITSPDIQRLIPLLKGVDGSEIKLNGCPNLVRGSAKRRPYNSQLPLNSGTCPPKNKPFVLQRNFWDMDHFQPSTLWFILWRDYPQYRRYG